MNIPFVDLQPSYQDHRQSAEEAIKRVLSSQRFILGPEVSAFEEAVQRYLGYECACIGTSSGSSALFLSMMAQNIGPGDEVIVPAYTFIATASAVSLLGAKPVFVDVEDSSLNMDPRLLEAALSEKTKAVIPVHLFGRSANLQRINEIVKSRPGPPVSLIEDCAQAFGAQYADKPLGSYGHAACFSFFPAKNLGGFGDGGLISTTDSALGNKIKALRVHGRTAPYYHEWIGINGRLDALQAAILNTKLPFIDKWISARVRNAEQYRSCFKSGGLDPCLISLPPEDDSVYRHTYNQFNLRVSNGLREPLKAFLAEQGIGTAVYYPIPLPFQPCYRSLGYSAQNFKVSLAAAADSLALPIYPGLKDTEIEYVVDKILGFLKKNA